MRTQAQESGRQYKAALYAQRESIQQNIRSVEQHRARLEEQAADLLEEIKEHHRQIALHETQAKSQQQQLLAQQKIRQGLEAQQTLQPEEFVTDAQQRWSLALIEAQEKQRHAQQALADAEGQKRIFQSQFFAVTEELEQIPQEIADGQRTLSIMQHLKQQIEADTWIQQVLELPVIHLEQLDSGILSYLKNALRTWEAQVIEQRRIEREHIAILQHMEAHRLLPPERNVQRVVEVLQQKQILAWSGWSYLAENKTNMDAKKVIAAHPDIVSGIVIRNTYFDQAVAVLTDLQIELDAPVVIAAERVLQDERIVPKRFVLIPTSDAFFDHDVAKQEQEHRQKQFEEDHQHLQKLEQNYEQLQSSIHRLQRFWDTYPQRWMEEKEEFLAQKTDQLQKAEKRKGELQGTQRNLEKAIEEHRRQEKQQSSQQKKIESHLMRLEANKPHFELSSDALEQAWQEKESQVRMVVPFVKTVCDEK